MRRNQNHQNEALTPSLSDPLWDHPDHPLPRMSLTFLHTADLHHASPLQGLAVRDDEAATELLGASRKAFDNQIRLAIDESVDFMVIAGDVYDRD